jgi:hypothetical protein
MSRQDTKLSKTNKFSHRTQDEALTRETLIVMDLSKYLSSRHFPSLKFCVKQKQRGQKKREGY